MATFLDSAQLSVDMAVCPYDENHVMKKNRLPYHLIKCAKNNAHIQLMECPYNRQHRVSSSQYQKHIEQCAQHAQLSMREDVDGAADAAKRSVDFLEQVENQVLCDWDDGDIRGFTVPAPQNQNVTPQLNMGTINFSRPVLTHREGDSVREEAQVDHKPAFFGIGRGRIATATSGRRFGTQGLGRAK